MYKDIQLARNALQNLPLHWDGKESIHELKRAAFNWRQVEWWSFYFELLCLQRLKDHFQIPGDRFGKAKTACFDFKGNINWDLKAKAIQSDGHRSILNDLAAMDQSLQTYGAHGLVVALCDVAYDNVDRVFQKWHEALKGGKSKHALDQEHRTRFSFYRITRAELQEILFLLITRKNIHALEIHHQGRNSNGKPRPPKYMLNFEDLEHFLVDRLVLL
ncbi:MAG: hypothetical protein ROW48_06950 [Bellilinea sp.]|jgi:hypothetical protein